MTKTTEQRRQSFLEKLQHSILLFDGATGTEFYRHHIFTNRCYDELNLSDPELVRRVLCSYRDAGVDVLTTNTFGANRWTLKKYGLAEKVTEINRRGAEIAVEVAAECSDRTIFIAGSVGPLASEAFLSYSSEKSSPAENLCPTECSCSTNHLCLSDKTTLPSKIVSLEQTTKFGKTTTLEQTTSSKKATPLEQTVPSEKSGDLPSLELPTRLQIKPNISNEQPKPIAVLQEQIAVLIESGVDFILFETQPSRKAMECCAESMIPFGDFPFILSCALFRDNESVAGESVTGESIPRLFAPFDEGIPQPAALGFNCGLGPDALLEAVEIAKPLISLPLIVQPNAGTPKMFEGRQLYYCSPEYFATYAKRYADLGVSGIGGCCGTTPEHIAEMVKTVRPLSKKKTLVSVLQTAAPTTEECPETEFAQRSILAWKLTNRKWVSSVELVPPKGYDLSETVEKCRKLRRQGVDAVNIPDGPRASSRMSSLIVAQTVQREAQLEPILHFCCRDKNLIGMQADLLGCAAASIQNILFITGDPPKLGNYPNATGVFDTDSIGMTAVQTRLNRGIDLGGQSIGKPTEAVIGVGLDPTSLDQKRELERFCRKVEAGAHFAITQPVFDADALLAFLDRIPSECQIPIIAGIWPLASYRNAVFMQNEVPGVVIPESMMQRMEQASKGTRDDQLNVGIETAREAIERIRGAVAGVQVSAPFGRIEIALDVLST